MATLFKRPKNYAITILKTEYSFQKQYFQRHEL